MAELDQIDRKIIAELMRDATLPVAQIADRVGLSQTPCWKRIQRLEASGIITGRVAMVGDSLHDLEAAQAAGMARVAVLTGIAKHEVLAPHADVVLADIGDLPGWLDTKA